VLDIRCWTIEMAGVLAHTHKDVPEAGAAKVKWAAEAAASNDPR
jgi:hypothetical protein